MDKISVIYSPGKVHTLFKVNIEEMGFQSLLTILIDAVALLWSGSTFQFFAVYKVNDHAPHKFFDLCSVCSSLFAACIFPRSGLYGLMNLHK